MELFEMIFSLFLLGSLGVAAITTIETANTTGWSVTLIVVWGLIGVMFVLGIVYKWMPKGGG
jgi:putative effector of murein hydrolase LrgA (UPF0299 family)